MQFFGLLGSLFFLVGVISIGSIITSKFLDPDFSATNKPAFYIALTSILIGMQLFLAGFIAEMVNRNAPDRNNYLIADKLGW